MCGICGLYNYGIDRPADENLVRRMTASIIHRGPDEDGFLFDDRLGLGMRRLSIIDLAGGKQPIANETGTVSTVFNGEIYNFQDLRSLLEKEGHAFRTRTDTETIVHAYEQWGFDSLSRLNGMYGLAVWDQPNRRLVVARDPFGVKPVYYWDNGTTLVFGSEIRTILCHPAVKREIDREALDQYLTLTYVPAPRTAFANIQKLPPGYALLCTPEGTKLERFYRVIPRTLTGYSEDDLVGMLREKIQAAVRRQMVADVPVGAMLSGGVDSTTIANLMTGMTDEPIDTFTVGFEGDFALNELDFARTEAARIGSTHHEVIISAEEFVDFFPTSIWHLEEPVATSSTLAYFKVCELARKHVKVVLTGQGADEPFAGYGRYVGEYYGRFYRSIPAPLRDGLIAPLARRLPRNEQLKRAVASLGLEDPFERMLAIYTIFDLGLKQRLYRDGQVPEVGFDQLKVWQSEVAHLEGMNQMTYMDSRLSLPDNLLLYGDKMSMAVSLEARVPFLDLELMELVESLPAGTKIRGRNQKYILKKAVEKWIPREVIDRRKIGFATPVDQWFRGAMYDRIREMLLDRDSACGIFFDPGTVETMLQDHGRGAQDYKRAIFALMTFESWYQQFIRPAAWTGQPA